MRRLLAVLASLGIFATLSLSTASAVTSSPEGYRADVGRMECSLDLLKFNWYIGNFSDHTANLGIYVNGREVVKDIDYLPGEGNSSSEVDGTPVRFRVPAGTPYSITVRADGVTYAEVTGVAPACSWGHQIRASQPRCVAGKPMITWRAVNREPSEYVTTLNVANGGAGGFILPYSTLPSGASLRGSSNLAKWLVPGQGFAIYKRRDLESDGRPVIGTLPNCRDTSVKYPHLTGLPSLRGHTSSRPYPGRTLTAVIGEWKPTPTQHSIQWYRWSDPSIGPSKRTPIPGATADTYTTTSADIGYFVGFKVRVKATGYADAFAFTSDHESMPMIYPPS